MHTETFREKFEQQLSRISCAWFKHCVLSYKREYMGRAVSGCSSFWQFNGANVRRCFLPQSTEHLHIRERICIRDWSYTAVRPSERRAVKYCDRCGYNLRIVASGRLKMLRTTKISDTFAVLAHGLMTIKLHIVPKYVRLHHLRTRNSIRTSIIRLT